MHIMIYFSFSTDSIIPWIALLNKCSLFIFTQFISHLQRKENSCYVMLIFLLAFEISSVISYISLNLSSSSGDLISMISSIFPVRMSLNPATSSPVQMLARITGFICSRSYVFFTIFFLNNPMLPPHLRIITVTRSTI